MEHQTPKKALFLALLCFFAFTTASALEFLETDAKDLLNAAADKLKPKEDLTTVVTDNVKGAVDQVKSAPPPLASSPTGSQPFSLGNIDGELRQICQNTDFPTECVQEVMPFYTGEADPFNVVKSAILGTMEKIKEAIAAARKMSSAARTPGVVTIINEVRESYEDALENFQSAMEALEAKDIGTLNTMLSAAITDFSDNEDKLSNKASELVAFDDELSKMTSNCLAISSMLPTNY